MKFVIGLFVGTVFGAGVIVAWFYKELLDWWRHT